MIWSNAKLAPNHWPRNASYPPGAAAAPDEATIAVSLAPTLKSNTSVGSVGSARLPFSLPGATMFHVHSIVALPTSRCTSIAPDTASGVLPTVPTDHVKLWLATANEGVVAKS